MSSSGRSRARFPAHSTRFTSRARSSRPSSACHRPRVVRGRASTACAYRRRISRASSRSARCSSGSGRSRPVRCARAADCGRRTRRPWFSRRTPASPPAPSPSTSTTHCPERHAAPRCAWSTASKPARCCACRFPAAASGHRPWGAIRAATSSSPTPASRAATSRVTVAPDGYLGFEDLGSSGTARGGTRRAGPARGPLHLGDRLQLGDTLLAVEATE